MFKPCFYEVPWCHVRRWEVEVKWGDGATTRQIVCSYHIVDEVAPVTQDSPDYKAPSLRINRVDDN